jgi:hypothetical protein
VLSGPDLQDVTDDLFRRHEHLSVLYVSILRWVKVSEPFFAFILTLIALIRELSTKATSCPCLQHPSGCMSLLISESTRLGQPAWTAHEPLNSKSRQGRSLTVLDYFT